MFHLIHNPFPNSEKNFLASLTRSPVAICPITENTDALNGSTSFLSSSFVAGVSSALSLENQ